MSKYLLDANILISAHRLFYAHDIVPSFWKWLEEMVPENIIIIDLVKDELTVEDDFLSNWVRYLLESNPANLIHTKSNQDIVNNYADVIDYIGSCGLYKVDSIEQWMGMNKADPFLIATAMTRNDIIVTLEKRHSGLNQITPTKQEPKIPDVADRFSIECINLYELMRRLGCEI